MGGPFSFGGTAAVGAFAAWNIEAGWHLPHSPPPSAGAVAAMRSGSSSGPRVSSDVTSSSLSRLPDALHIALDGVSASPIPIASQAAGVASGLWYALEGSWWNAGLSLAGLLPVAGAVPDLLRLEAAGSAFRGAQSLSIHEGRLNLFKWGQESTYRGTNWADGDFMLFLPDLHNVKLNWGQNAGKIRQEMKRRRPIVDSYRDPVTGQQIPTRGFLNAERKLIEARGWKYDASAGAYLPPGN